MCEESTFPFHLWLSSHSLSLSLSPETFENEDCSIGMLNLAESKAGFICLGKNLNCKMKKCRKQGFYHFSSVCSFQQESFIFKQPIDSHSEREVGEVKTKCKGSFVSWPSHLAFPFTRAQESICCFYSISRSLVSHLP